MKKIILLRHAKVLIDLDKKIYANEFKLFLDEYKKAEISNVLVNKEKISALIKHSDIIVSSEEKRAKESYLLYAGLDVCSNKIYNEVELPYISQKLIKIKTKYWLYIFRILWLFSFSKNCESYKESKLRASLASKELINLAKTNNNVMLFGHGLMNKLIKRELIKQEYKLEKHSNNANWDYDTLIKIG